MKPIIITHKECLEHNTGPFHPERPERILAALQELKEYEIKEARLATEEDLALCHTLPYIATVKDDIAKKLPILSTGDVVLSKDSFKSALRAVGGALDGVDQAFNNRRSFVVVRPPGHHAESDKGMGFCLFNNAAIAARYAQKKYGIRKVLIADWDVHHGNGTEEIFKNDPTVYYFSTHQHPLYPGTGLASSLHICNVPIKAEPGARENVIKSFLKLETLMEQFKPELVIISAGFDAHRLDPLGGLDLTEKDFLTLTEVLSRIANRHAEGRLVSCLEGGYDLDALRLSAKAHMEAL